MYVPSTGAVIQEFFRRKWPYISFVIFLILYGYFGFKCDIYLKTCREHIAVPGRTPICPNNHRLEIIQGVVFCKCP